MTAALIAAPSSGAGKTTVALALGAALRKLGWSIRSVKLGPDYIDPGFHAAATGQPCYNLDALAMERSLQGAVLGAGPVVVEAAMGLFDGAGLNGRASAADIASSFDLPIVLVLDCAALSHSVAAIVRGIVSHDPRLRFNGLILNRVGSVRHEAMLRTALADPMYPPILGCLPRRPDLKHPSRHLGLLQAHERADLEDWLARLAEWISRNVDVERVLSPWTPPPSEHLSMRPPAQRIAIAQDAAFSFFYPHQRDGWRKAGAELSFFSPLADEPPPSADLIYLPGGYPELFAGQIGSSYNFISGLKKASQDTPIYGECGGYMVLGDGLIDAEGNRHPMAALLRLETSFERRKLQLGYRRLNAVSGPMSGEWYGHEFHYSTELLSEGAALFKAWDSDGAQLSPMGLRAGNVSGSYAHLIAPRCSDGRHASGSTEVSDVK
ncbi:MAG: cobyrinate a,c-diamide synthase [Pseudomonadota bacterium]